MEIFGLSITRTTKAAPKDLATIPGDRGNWWYRISEPFTGAWQRNIDETPESLLTFSAVYACISLISGDIGKLGWSLVEQGADGIWRGVNSAAFTPVLRKPNRFQNRIKFVEAWILSKLIHGNAYVLKERDGRGVVIAMYVLDPTRVRVLVAPDGAVYYQLSRDDLAGLDETFTGERLVVPASEIIHDPMIALYHPLVGVSPLAACATAAMQGLAIQRNSHTFFLNGSRPSGILTAPGAISQEAADRLKTTWEEKFGGGNIGKVAVLGDGLTYTPMSVDAVDAQLIEQLKWSAETVCSVFHVPPFMVGIGPTPAYNNIQALNQQYYTQCLQELIESMEAALDEGLGLTDIPGKIYGVSVDIEALLRMDTSTQVKTYAEGVKGGLFKPNEGRAKFDLEPVEGGDEVYLQQQNYSLAALAKRDAKEDPFSSSKPPAPAPEPGDEPDGDEPPEGEDDDDEAAEDEARGFGLALGDALGDFWGSHAHA